MLSSLNSPGHFHSSLRTTVTALLTSGIVDADSKANISDVGSQLKLPSNCMMVLLILDSTFSTLIRIRKPVLKLQRSVLSFRRVAHLHKWSTSSTQRKQLAGLSGTEMVGSRVQRYCRALTFVQYHDLLDLVATPHLLQDTPYTRSETLCLLSSELQYHEPGYALVRLNPFVRSVSATFASVVGGQRTRVSPTRYSVVASR